MGDNRTVSTVVLPSGLTLSYSDRGDTSAPAVLLLPGPTDSWRSYEPILELLPRGVRTIAVSQRGHGDSDKPAAGYGVEDFAGDVVPMLDTLGISEAVIVGHSGSCLVARRVALDHPDRVAGLILEASPTTLCGEVRLLDFVETVVASLADPIGRDFARSVVVDTSSTSLPPDVVEALVDELLKVPAHVWKEMFAQLLHYDDTKELPQLEPPTLLIWGDADTLISREMQARLEGSIPDAELLVYPDVGHTPRWEDPTRFSGDVLTFARRIGK
jgi:pimeloyl-ACP methyl ester carboxylesterase